MENKFKKRVVVGISGGVDSAVSAYLLQQQGYEVIGLFMSNWDSLANQENNFISNDDKCEAQLDFDDAKKVCEKLGIKIYYKQFVKEYWDHVFTYFLHEYQQNRTPNPDVLCNREIKFDAFKEYAFKKFGCDYIATGHYAKIVYKNNLPHLALCKDQNKDQTYFLCALSQEQLKNVLFPLQDLTKQEVREIASRIGLVNAQKKDSTGICFIGKRNFRQFLENYLPNQPGPIIDITNNKIIGTHIGTMYYTIGQRKGLNLSGLNEKYFVCQKDLQNKIIYIAPSSLEDEFLNTNYLEINEFNWIADIDFSNQKPIYARFRHCQPLQQINLEFNGAQVIVRYTNQKNVVPGQYCVLYQDGICLGGGSIDLVAKK